MDYGYLLKLRQHPAWRLLMADYAPLIISFFYQSFIKPGTQSCLRSDLAAKLDDFLFHLRQIDQTNAYARSAQQYLDDWAHGDNAYLRKYYPDQGDEPCFELTAASEKAMEWLKELEQKSFIGTESRLLTIFQLLREVVLETQSDPALRIAELEKEKAEIEARIARARQGTIEPYDPTRIKERYYEIVDSARRLLSDFRQVEENFRQLDYRTREKIAVSPKGKGDLLDEIFGEEDAISRSDQGRSFRAFWEFLMLTDRQEELEEMVAKLLKLKEIQSFPRDDLLPFLKYRLMEAGEKVNKTTSSLVEHLRRFLDEQVWLENKRIMGLIRSIEKNALHLRQEPPDAPAFMWLDDLRPSIELPMARSLYIPPKNTIISGSEIIAGEADFDNDELYEIHYVDEEELKGRIWKILQEEEQVSLKDICSCFPLEKGLSELLVYVNLAAKDQRAVIENEAGETITWVNGGQVKTAFVPRIIFTRMAVPS